MATEKLFGNHIKPSCLYCEEGFVSADSDNILCVKNGVVTPDYSCKSFRYDPIKRVPARPMPLDAGGQTSDRPLPDSDQTLRVDYDGDRTDSLEDTARALGIDE